MNIQEIKVSECMAFQDNPFQVKDVYKRQLQDRGLTLFDEWASTFGEVTTSVELKPEGTGYRMRTRFSRFYNLPELMALWREAADIQTADMLNLPVPEVERKNVVVKPTNIQREMVAELGERAEAVRNGNVDPSEDLSLIHIWSCPGQRCTTLRAAGRRGGRSWTPRRVCTNTAFRSRC